MGYIKGPGVLPELRVPEAVNWKQNKSSLCSSFEVPVLKATAGMDRMTSAGRFQDLSKGYIRGTGDQQPQFGPSTVGETLLVITQSLLAGLVRSGQKAPHSTPVSRSRHEDNSKNHNEEARGSKNVASFGKAL